MAVIKTENLTYVYGEGTPFRKTAVLITVLLQNPKTYLQSKKAVLKYILQEGL